LRLIIDALDVDIATEAGPFGVRLAFSDGLNLISGKNSSGKSTCVQAILYALGLETIFSGSQRPVFAPVVTSHLENAVGVDIPVKGSEVFLQIANVRGERITLRRCIKGMRDTRLISVYAGPLLTDSVISGRTDYFVSVEGAAQRERGFHRFLAGFLGLELPRVVRYDSSEVPLYIQTLAPLFFVEQKRGWSGVQANTPTFYQIKDVQKRALEYVLGLEVSELIRKRLDLLERRQNFQSLWQRGFHELNILVAQVNGQVRGIDSALSSQDKPPVLDVLVHKSGRYQNLDAWIAGLETALTKIDADVMPSAQRESESWKRELAEGEERLALLRVDARMLYERAVSEEGEATAIRERIQTLQEDKKRNQDVRRLQEYGSPKTSGLTDAKCPTCGQLISDTIVPQILGTEVLSIDDQLAFIDSQIEAFQAVLPSTAEAGVRTRQALNDLRQSIDVEERRLAELRRVATGSSNPTLAAMRRRVQAETELDQAVQARDAMFNLIDYLQEQFHEYKQVQREYEQLPKGDLTERDLVALRSMAELLRSQLREYGFRSVGSEEVDLSQDSYKPIARGLDLFPQVSGSDAIRAIWGYITALLELSRTNSAMHHFGVVIFDEPRQQEAELESYESFCQRLSTTRQYRQQAIVASSLVGLSRELAEAGLANSLVFDEKRLMKERDAATYAALGIDQ
jgi:hypothetical protein